MSVIITLEDIQAYAEIDYIIHHMNEKYVEKIPKKLLEFFSSIKDPNYEVYVDPHKPLQSQGLKKYTLEVIAILHVKYWCENEARKAELIAKMQENQDKFEEQLREQFSVDKLFNNPSAKVVTSLDDLDEKEDYSKPRAIRKFSAKEELSNNIENSNVNNAEGNNIKENKYPQRVEKKQGLFAKIRNFFRKKK